MDVLYPVGTGSRWNNQEIKFSLRSIEKHLTNYGKIYVIGERPNLQNINFIPLKDGKHPGLNIWNKVLTACQSDISENFLFFNDDHFLLQNFDACTFPYYCNSTLEAYVKNRGNDLYGRIAKNSLSFLQDRQLPTKFFDIHYPMRINKNRFLELNSQLKPTVDGYIMKSLYANFIQAEGTEIRDCKMKVIPTEHFKCFSTFPGVVEGLQDFMKRNYPKKSIYE